MKKSFMNLSVNKLSETKMSNCKGGRGKSSFPPAIPTQAGDVALPSLPDLPVLPSQSRG